MARLALTWGDIINKPLIPGVAVTAGRIRRLHEHHCNMSDCSTGNAQPTLLSVFKDDSSETQQTSAELQFKMKTEKAICVLKLCVAQIACGEISTAVEEHIRRVSLELELEDNPQIVITNRDVAVQFGAGPAILVECSASRSIALSKLNDITQLALLLQKRHLLLLPRITLHPLECQACPVHWELWLL